jgi:hypothetical protein
LQISGPERVAGAGGTGCPKRGVRLRYTLQPRHLRRRSYVEYHRDRSSDRFSSSSMLPTCCSWSIAIIFDLTRTLTTSISMARVVLPRPARFPTGCRRASKRSRHGWRPTEFNSTRRRPRSSGVRLPGVDTKSRLSRYASAPHQSCRLLQSGTSESTSTPTSPSGPTLTPSSGRALRRFDKSAACGVPYHVTPC